MRRAGTTREQRRNVTRPTPAGGGGGGDLRVFDGLCREVLVTQGLDVLPRQRSARSGDVGQLSRRAVAQRNPDRRTRSRGRHPRTDGDDGQADGHARGRDLSARPGRDRRRWAAQPALAAADELVNAGIHGVAEREVSDASIGEATRFFRLLRKLGRRLLAAAKRAVFGDLPTATTPRETTERRPDGFGAELPLMSDAIGGWSGTVDGRRYRVFERSFSEAMTTLQATPQLKSCPMPGSGYR